MKANDAEEARRLDALWEVRVESAMTRFELTCC